MVEANKLNSKIQFRIINISNTLPTVHIVLNFETDPFTNLCHKETQYIVLCLIYITYVSIRCIYYKPYFLDIGYYPSHGGFMVQELIFIIL